MKKVDLNVDIGEGFPFDEALLEFATSANICCGAHAGNLELTRETIALCKAKNRRIGCHPGFPDRETMGRRIPHEIPPAWWDGLVEQVEAFHQLGKPEYLKPHGAWYNLLIQPSDVSPFKTLYRILERWPMPVMILPIAPLATGTAILKEGFADRGYDSEGRLLSRYLPNALLTCPQEIEAQVRKLAPMVDSISLHGDTPDCVEFAELVYRTLVDAGYEVGY